MRYVSTRGDVARVGFHDIVAGGLAPDGGLWVPETYPRLAAPATAAGEYPRLATDVMRAYADDVESGPLEQLVRAAYAVFDDPEVCPLRQLADDLWLLELFHGPTLAFKDVALQVLGRLLDDELRRRGTRATILVATSGDTGAAAIAACVGRAALDIVVVHPAGRVSDVQRRQMTTVDAPNVHNLAIEGTFDDCQDLVKALLADDALRQAHGLAAMNSINWTRVAAQTVYYEWAVRQLGRPAAFAVPSGNFGNAFAGWVAHRMGTAIERIVIGTNRNDLLFRWLAFGVLERREVVATVTPAIDIQVPSNLERLLFELVGRDGDEVRSLMARFRERGRVEAPRDPLLIGARLDDDQTRSVMADVHAETDVVVDPHTAVAIGAARACRARLPDGVPIVCLATAHPAKFPETVNEATGLTPDPPASLEAALTRPERYDTLPAEFDAVRAFLARL
ncbi:MAG: threonine synthase [Acidimicrobiales bacterium]